ncbi:uncharacterized protein BDZ99DRAFT_191506 [Mytilinidion resinicola]|uniref:Uncharacterized protein n=1 Tax=Mytilinidion resinicola TaxID=574789 RepID=A0A6A6Z3B4_9PEZI|nr:uncharacterized protein BDZ99DRAFT_191506 [Mytilinidion resinicola]KAF2815163.1 hypothetical protein BDZ99DRAFT_191506 [Mytilinidion resinicola]
MRLISTAIQKRETTALMQMYSGWSKPIPIDAPSPPKYASTNLSPTPPHPNPNKRKNA